MHTFDQRSTQHKKISRTEGKFCLLVSIWNGDPSRSSKPVSSHPGRAFAATCMAFRLLVVFPESTQTPPCHRVVPLSPSRKSAREFVSLLFVTRRMTDHRTISSVCLSTFQWAAREFPRIQARPELPGPSSFRKIPTTSIAAHPPLTPIRGRLTSCHDRRTWHAMQKRAGGQQQLLPASCTCDAAVRSANPMRTI